MQKNTKRNDLSRKITLVTSQSYFKE